MNKIILTFAILIFPLCALTLADQPEQVITLKDGSQIKGVLSGIDKGVYTVKTPIIGDVHVAASDVASISNGNVAVSGDTLNLDQQITAGQKQLISNPQSMAILQEMAQDPEIVKMLSDPELVQAVTSHNYEAVQNNPKIQEMLSNPKMQALMQKLAAQMQQQNTSSQ